MNLPFLAHSDWQATVAGLAFFTIAVFVGSAVLGWWMIIRLPVDYLVREEKVETETTGRPLVRWVTRIGRNLIGGLLAIAGLIMLVTPGQGILCIFMGLTVMDFPGKRRLVRRIVGRPQVLRGLNRVRARADRLPLQEPTEVP